MSIAADIIRALIKSPALIGFKAHAGMTARREPNGNELAIFLHERPWSTVESSDLEMTFGVRSAKLAQFDRDILRIPQPRLPRLGRMHYERSLGWLLRGEEPRYGGAQSPAAIAEQMLPVVVSRVLPHLEAHATDEAIASALYASSPLDRQPLHELLRLQYLLDTSGDARAKAVSEALARPDRGAVRSSPIVEAVTAEIERRTGAVAVNASKFRR